MNLQKITDNNIISITVDEESNQESGEGCACNTMKS